MKVREILHTAPILYYTILYYTILCYTILYYTISYYTNYTKLYNTIQTILYYTILYYTILYYTILYYTILYHTVLFYCKLLLFIFSFLPYQFGLYQPSCSSLHYPSLLTVQYTIHSWTHVHTSECNSLPAYQGGTNGEWGGIPPHPHTHLL